jgi:hypothetical protein
MQNIRWLIDWFKLILPDFRAGRARISIGQRDVVRTMAGQGAVSVVALERVTLGHAIAWLDVFSVENQICVLDPVQQLADNLGDGSGGGGWPFATHLTF